MKIWEVVDKATILKIKMEKGLDCKSEYLKYETELKDIEPRYIRKLYKINKELWNVESKLEQVVEDGDITEAGLLYIEARKLTHKRTKAKNLIANKYGEFGEIKKY